jgi:anti-sigma B factor antagonist
MAATLAEAQVRIEGDTAVITLSGDINGLAEPVMAEAYGEAEAAGSTKVILNFADTEFINSTGIAVIVGMLAKARATQRTVSACGLSEHYQHIFEITRLADFMPMYPDETSALAAS